MKYLLELSTLLAALSFAISLINLLSMRVLRILPDSSAKIKARYSILVPMRNEERNAEELVQQLLNDEDTCRDELVVLDDHSTDSTLERLMRFATEITVLRGKPKTSEWMGKPYACHQLSTHADSDFLVFIDADVRLKPGAVRSGISMMERNGWDYLSPYPRQVAPTLLLRLIQPLLQWSWFSSVPLRFAESGRFRSMIIANGQFLIIRRKAYEEVGGHQSVKAEVLEDLELVRNLNSAGFRGAVADGSSVALCTMYESNADMVKGYTKSLWRAFGTPSGEAIAVALILSTQILPATLLVTGHSQALIPYLIIGVTHCLSALKTRSSAINSILHPISAFILLGLLCESHRRHRAGKLEWRGRTVI